MIALTIKDLNFLLGYYSFFRWFLLVVAVFALVKVKLKNPDHHSEVKVSYP